MYKKISYDDHNNVIYDHILKTFGFQLVIENVKSYFLTKYLTHINIIVKETTYSRH